MTADPRGAMLLVETCQASNHPGRHTPIEDEAALSGNRRNGQRFRLKVIQMFGQDVDGEDGLPVIFTRLHFQIRES